VNIAVWYLLGGYAPYIYEIFENREFLELKSLWVIIPFVMFVPFSAVIFKFLYFHYTLIDRNMTTMEVLDRERTKEPADAPSKVI